MVRLRSIRGAFPLALLALLGGGASEAATPGTTISWRAVRDQPGSANVIPLACASADSSHRLFLTFIPSLDLPDFVGLEAVVDFGYFTPPHGTSPPLSPFWHFETGGCNEVGLTYDVRTSTGTGLPNLWTSILQPQASYAPDYPNPGVGRLQISIYRTSPVALQAGTEYFALTLDLSTCLAGICPGCDEDVGIHFASAYLVGETESEQVQGIDDRSLACANSCVVFSSVAAGGPVARAVDATEQAAFRPLTNASSVCLVTPVRRSAWGELKVLYR